MKTILDFEDAKVRLVRIEDKYELDVMGYNGNVPVEGDVILMFDSRGSFSDHSLSIMRLRDMSHVGLGDIRKFKEKLKDIVITPDSHEVKKTAREVPAGLKEKDEYTCAVCGNIMKCTLSENNSTDELHIHEDCIETLDDILTTVIQDLDNYMKDAL